MKKLLKRNKQKCYPLPGYYHNIVAVRDAQPNTFYPLLEVDDEAWKELLTKNIVAPIPLYFHSEKNKFKIWPEWNGEDIKIYKVM